MLPFITLDNTNVTDELVLENMSVRMGKSDPLSSIFNFEIGPSVYLTSIKYPSVGAVTIVKLLPIILYSVY